MVRRCLLCGPNQRENLTYFRFPKNPLSSAWAKFCHMERKDIRPSHTLCCKHFMTNDVIDNRANGGFLKLKPNAIPSVSVRKLRLQHDELMKDDTEKIHSRSVTGENKGSLANRCTSDEVVASTSDIVKSNSEVDTYRVQNDKEFIKDNIKNLHLRSIANDKNKRTMANCFMPDEVDGTCAAEYTIGISCMSTEVDTAVIGGATKRRRTEYPRYSGDISSCDVSTPQKARIALHVAVNTINTYKHKVGVLQQRNRRLVGKIKSLKGVIEQLKDKKLLSEDAANILMISMPDYMREIIEKKLTQKKRKCSPKIRTFALTLQFYSARAYDYVRRVWNNLLPHPSTIRKWYAVIDGKPGFTKEAFDAIKLESENNETALVCNVVIDEIAIREQLQFDHNEFYGCVNLGTNLATDYENIPLATNALVFMAVSVKFCWKVPLGYFLIKNFSSSERANLLRICLELLHASGVEVYSITFDGAAVNGGMCVAMGSNFGVSSKAFQPWFSHPVTKKRIYVCYDPSHMIKLIRNALAEKGPFFDAQGREISWKHIYKLYETQETERLAVAVKLNKKHVHFNDNKMNVKLAAQVLSESVANGLQYLQKLGMTLEDLSGTAKFCLVFNNIFDILNCRNIYSHKPYNIPVNHENLQFLQESANEYIQYIMTLKDQNGNLIVNTNRKTGFVGFVISLQNLFNIYSETKLHGQHYLLSFKLSQDHIENFFSALRSRGGFNNNLNAKQFEASYKRLLIRHEVNASEKSNCLINNFKILHASSYSGKATVPEDFGNVTVNSFDHDYIKTMWSLSPFVENITEYIAGYIVKKVKKSVCQICADELCNNNRKSLLIDLKNRGSLIKPSADVCYICKISEKLLRQNEKEMLSPNFKNYMIITIFKSVGSSVFNSDRITKHCFDQDPMNNHRTYLIKFIIATYLKTRLFYIGKISSQRDEYIRNKYTKLVIFKHQ